MAIVQSVLRSFDSMVKPWRRQAHAIDKSLPYKIEVSLHGIPAHAWEMASVVQLLSAYCWIEQLHLSTHDCSDPSIFRLST